jgi:hypothetical protein
MKNMKNRSKKMKKNMKNRSKKINKSKSLRHNNCKHIGGGLCWSGPEINSQEKINRVAEAAQKDNESLSKWLEELKELEDANLEEQLEELESESALEKQFKKLMETPNLKALRNNELKCDVDVCFVSYRSKTYFSLSNQETKSCFQEVTL